MKPKNVLLGADVNKKLLAYTAGAGAAMMAGSGAQAAIVWSGNLTLDFGNIYGAQELTMEGSQAEVLLDGALAYGVYPYLAADRVNNLFSVVGTTMLLIQMLEATEQVSYSRAFIPDGGFYVDVGSPVGAWDVDGGTGYFGFVFELENESASGAPAGTAVYGWAQVERLSPLEGRLLQWAYEDSGDPIQVGMIPEPGTLGMLALGAAGLAALRRRRAAE